MCGRTACSLEPDALQRACCYRCKWSGRQREPPWLGGNDGTGDKSTYYPSYNVCPQNRTPVLVNAVTENGQRALQVMKWGLIPSWHKGDSNSFAYNMSNARLDTLQEKASFRTPLNKGQRCVVLADGFFEWQSTPEGKRPYFVYFKPSKGGNEFEEPYVKKITPRLLTMAGLFDIWMPPKGSINSRPLYSYTIVTVDAAPCLKWLHHRMPAILDGEDAVSQWLDCGTYNAEKALLMLRPVENLTWHPVSSVVNNSRNKSEECVKQVDLSNPKAKRDTGLTKWLKKSPTKQEDNQSVTTNSESYEHNAPPPDEDEDEEPPAKRPCWFDEFDHQSLFQ